MQPYLHYITSRMPKKIQGYSIFLTPYIWNTMIIMIIMLEFLLKYIFAKPQVQTTSTNHKYMKAT